MPSLTGITALDVAIGLAFVYLLFSVLCAAAQEAIAGILDLRAGRLEAGLRNLLADDGTQTGGAPAGVQPAAGGASPASSEALFTEVLGHGLMRTQYQRSRLLIKRKRRGPSYIAPQTFALALLDIVAPADGPQDSEDLQATIAGKSIPAGTKNALTALAKEAGEDRDEFRKLVEQWFDAGMSRVSGWYKRRTQIVVCVLSAGVAVGLNVNTIAIADRLIHDDAMRQTVVDQARKSTINPEDSLDTAAKKIRDVQALGLPLGWNKKPGDPVKADLREHPARTIGGWLLTFLALSLGAPFWFDTLNKLAGLRNAGSKPKPAPAPAV